MECLKSVEKYNPEENVWESLPAMLEARGRFGACAINNRVYAVGGSNGTTELAKVECYNPEKEKWSAVAPLPTAKSNAGECTPDTLYGTGSSVFEFTVLFFLFFFFYYIDKFWLRLIYLF